ncbi:unnamed protein product, partial [Ostreobium quekettii]
GAGLWGRLLAEGSKEDILKRRNDSIEECHARLQEAQKRRLEQREKFKKEVSDQEIESDRRKRRTIEELKEKELQSERSHLAEWQQGGPSRGRISHPGAEENWHDQPCYHGRGYWPGRYEGGGGQGDQGREGERSDGASRNGEGGEAERRVGEIWECGEEACEGEEACGECVAAEEGEVPGGVTFAPLPPPRQPLQSVSVQFTKLETDHLPARESREEDIRIYKKQNRGIEGAGDGGVDIGDRQPAFLKDKGDALYEQRNYEGAANAYSRAIELDPSPAVYFANRAACHFKMGRHEACAGDCTAALERLRPQKEKYESGALAEGVEKFKRLMSKVLGRRAASRCAMKEFGDAEADFAEAA